MNVKEQRVRSPITQEAADWFVANREGLTAKDRQTFAAWLKASPVHVEEYLALSVIARDLRAACEMPQNLLDEVLSRARRDDENLVRPLWPRLLESLQTPPPRWKVAAVAMAVVGVVSIGLLVLLNHRPAANMTARNPVTEQRFETRHGEQQTYRLADNSILHLNTDTTVTVRYSQKERLVTLAAGEADFEVAHEPSRPFRVFAGPAEVVDLGTRFDVRLQDGSTRVIVAEGWVAVGPSSQAPNGRASQNDAVRFVQMSANQQITVSDGQWPASPVPVDAPRARAWLHRQMVFDREALERVAAEFNRYASKPIEITTPALGKLEVSGVFATDDSEAFVAFLRSLNGVHVEVTATMIRVSQD